MTIRLTPVKHILTGFEPRIGQTLYLGGYFIPREYKVVSYVARKNLLWDATVTPIYTTEEAVRSLLEDQ